MEQQPWAIENYGDGDVGHLKGWGTKRLLVIFSSYQPDWAAVKRPNGFDFLNSAIRVSTDALMIRDTRNLWYHGGVEGLGTDPLQMADAIEKFTSQYSEVVTLGSSMGGYAALLFGHLLGADKTIAVVPQIRIGTTAAKSIGDGRWVGEFANIDAVARYKGLLSLDYLPISGNLIYGEADQEDKNHLATLSRHCSVNAITLPDQDHNGAAIAFLKGGMLDDLLKAA